MTYIELLEILESSESRITDEGKLLKAILKWIDHDPDNRKQHANSLFGLVQFQNISPEEKESDEEIKEICEDYKVRDKLTKFKCQIIMMWFIPQNGNTVLKIRRQTSKNAYICAVAFDSKLIEYLDLDEEEDTEEGWEILTEIPDMRLAHAVEI